MRLLANENVPRTLVDALVSRGHDVNWIRQTAPGATDKSVLDLAREQNRIVLTFDKDFGELAFRTGIPATSRVILLRLSAASPEYLARPALRSIESRSDWEGHFSVITPERIRMTSVRGSP